MKWFLLVVYELSLPLLALLIACLVEKTWHMIVWILIAIFFCGLPLSRFLNWWWPDDSD